jgi:hypothetical protein
MAPIWNRPVRRAVVFPWTTALFSVLRCVQLDFRGPSLQRRPQGSGFLLVDFSGALRAPMRALILAACMVWAGPASAASVAGRPVQEVLEDLARENGINFIYNTDLVPPRLTVASEPPPGDAISIAREILAPHDLTLSPVGENAYAVVRDGGRPGPGTAAAGPGDEPGAESTIAVAPELAEMVVTTSRYALAYQEPQPHVFLTQADVRAMPKLADEPLRSVQRLPGATAAVLSAQANIRGGETNEVLMVLDGLPLYEPFHLKNFLAPVSLLDDRAIEAMDVSLGGFTANYGDRMSGVIDISSLTVPEERYTELGWSLFHASALSAGRFAGDRGQWLGAVRRSNLDIISHLVNSKYGEPEYFDAFGRASFALTDTTTLFGSVLTSRDEAEINDSDKSEQVDVDYRNTYVWGGWEQQWPFRFTSRLMLALTDIDNGREGTIDDPGERTGAVNERRTLRTGLARLDVSHRAERFFTRFGAEGREVKARYDYLSELIYAPDYPLPGDTGETVQRDLSPVPEGHQFGAWLTTRMRISDQWNVELGARWDDQTYDDVEGPEQFSPRLNLMYDLNPATRLRAAWGRFWQAQGPNELQVEDGIGTFWEPQKADHLIVSLERDLRADLDLRIELYQKDYDRVRPHFENLFDPVTLIPEFEPDRIEVAPDHARARGAEMLLSWRDDDPWSGWLSYAWSRVTDKIDGDDVPRSWDQRHSISAGMRYAGPHWEFSVVDTYHTGWPTTSLKLASDPLGGPDQVVAGPRNGARFSYFNSLDFRAMRRYPLPESSLELWFELTNALGRRNPCCTEYTVTAPGGVTLIDRDEDYWPRFIPSVGVLWKF